MSVQEGLPILCGRCGGPVEPKPDWSLSCSYCGAQDRLPEDALRRELEIKRRLAAAARSAAQLQGLNAVVASLFERRGLFRAITGLGLGVTLLALVMVVGLAVAQGGSTPTMLGHALFLWLYVSVPVGLLLSVVLTLLIGQRSYRRRVRAELLAHPPREEGAPMRCRVCGGDLPDEPTAFVRCRYCGAQSLATAEVHRSRLELLRREEQSYRNRASQAVGHVAHVGLRMNRILAVCAVLTFVVTYGLIWVSQALLP